MNQEMKQLEKDFHSKYGYWYCAKQPFDKVVCNLSTDPTEVETRMQEIHKDFVWNIISYYIKKALKSNDKEWEKKMREAKGIISDLRTRHNIDMDEDNDQDRLVKTYLSNIMGKLNDAQVFSETILDM